MRVRQITLSLLVFLPLIVIAANNQIRQPQHDEELPDAELLEFIAEFEPLEDQWIDPIQLNTIFAETPNGKDNK
ncbi:MAG: hypothetical protein WBO73_17970 [Gammaproteobacteria bacterium]|jgi:hypothetical protein